MSTLPDNELDLEKLFLPAWAQESAKTKSYENYTGAEETPRRREGNFGQRPRREGPGGQRPRGVGGPENRSREGGRPGENRGSRPSGPRDTRFRGDRRRAERDQGRREPPPPLPEITLTLVPEERGVDSLARQIKMTGRAYPLFDIAQMILQKPERHTVSFATRKNAEGTILQKLYLCALDDSLWLSDDEAVDHVLRRHFATFYQAEKTATEPPKGKYTFVAQCGMSGIVLGPPNLNDYQANLRKLHAERYSRLPFEVYKSRVKIVRDEEVVKKWIEDQSWKTEYICLNVPEPVRLQTMESVSKHFRETHKEAIIKEVETHSISGTAARSLRSQELGRAFRSAWEDQRRFPLQIATVLSQQFASRGLQFFKVDKTVTHVSVARPHFLDLEATPVSEGVRKIVNFLNAHGKCTRRQLIESLAPKPAIVPVPVSEPPRAEPVEGQAASAPASAGPSAPEPTPEQTALVADLHWLIHQGHVIEFANGVMETAKKPLPKPPKPEKKPPAPAPAAPAADAGTTETAPVATESANPAETQTASAESMASEAREIAGAVAEPAQPTADAQMAVSPEVSSGDSSPAATNEPGTDPEPERNKTPD